jgi:transcriptional regulator with XRE-family HTH domain
MPRINPSEEFQRGVAARLTLARVALGKTQAAIARALAVTQPRWNNWERGIRLPDPAVMAEFALKFGVRTDYIWCGSLIGMPADLQARIVELNSQGKRS